MTVVIGVVAVLVAVGFPMGWLMTRSTTLGLLLAPLVTGLVCSAAAIASTVTGAPLLPWVVFIAIVGTCACWWQEPQLSALPIRPTHLCGIIAIAAPLIALYQFTSVGWDARSIWWFHAEWFRAGGAKVAEAMTEPSFRYSHADYPPLASATIATVAAVLGQGLESRVAQAVSFVMSFAALILMAVSLTWVVRARTPLLVWATVVVAGLFALGAAGFEASGLSDGYVDNLWSAWFVLAALLLLLHPYSRSAVLLGSLALAAAVLTKNEAFPIALVLVVLATIRHRRHLRQSWFIAIPIGLGIVWQVLARIEGAQSDLQGGGHIVGLVTGDPAVIGRIGPTLGRMFADIGWFAAASIVVSVLGMLLTVSVRRWLGVGLDVWFWALFVASLGMLVIAFAVSPYNLVWHLGTALNRTTVHCETLLLALVSVNLLLALHRLLVPPPSKPASAHSSRSNGVEDTSIIAREV